MPVSFDGNNWNKGACPLALPASSIARTMKYFI
jgi:hypothetical protein